MRSEDSDQPQVKLKKPDSEAYAHKLRNEAHLAYLDGRVARSRALNKAADQMAVRLRRRAA